VARSAKAPLLAALGCVVALGLLALCAYAIDSFQHLDARVLRQAMDHRLGSTGSTAEFLAHLSDPLPLLAMLAAACAIALRRRRPLDTLGAVVIVAGANLTTQAMKVVFAHPRFHEFLGTYNLGEASFPSGHATAAASIAIAFALVVPGWVRPVVALFGVSFYAAVGGSILILGWHYPSDILAGGLVASAWGLAVLAVLRVADPERGKAEEQAQVSSRAAISVK